MQRVRMESVGHIITWAARMMTRSMDRRLRDAGLSAAQVPVLMILSEEGPLSQKDLVARAAIEQPAMVGTLNRMEGAGLVVRSRDPADKRSRIFDLTEQGRGQLITMWQAAMTGNDIALAGFDDHERLQLLAMLRRMLENLAQPTRTATQDRPPRGQADPQAAAD